MRRDAAGDLPAALPDAGRAGIDRAIALWRAVEFELAPIVGRRGALAVLHRTLSLNRAALDWLPARDDDQDLDGAIAGLHAAFALQRPHEADAAAQALSATFGELLSSLVGAALAEQLWSGAAFGRAMRRPSPRGRDDGGASARGDAPAPSRRDRGRHAQRRPQRGADLEHELRISEKNRTLFLLDARIAAARAELAREQGRDAHGERRSVNRHEARLVHANERLALCAIDAGAAAEAAVKLSQPDLRDANEHLVLAVIGAQGLQGQAEQIHQRQVMFLSTVAHELRNPLDPIRTASELLRHAAASDEQVARVQAILRRQVTHLARLVDDLMDGARASTGKFKLECSTVSLRDVLDPVIAAVRPAMAERRQTLALQWPQSALTVHADPIRLTQVFTNLLDNASKYGSPGGAIGLDLSTDGRVASLCVTDDGIGITAEALPHIFDLFVQEIHARAHDGQGLGIGLAVVRELVESHGGTIHASSAGRGLGSRFVVTLPLLSPSPAATVR